MIRTASLFISLVVLFIAIALTPSVKACRAVPLKPEYLTTTADVIVRARAVNYEKPSQQTLWTTGVPDATVAFLVIKVLKGEDVPTEIIINGYLVDKDDFNDRPAPYDFIRPGGRSGSCIANSYKIGADFLLFLKKKDDSFTPYWAALSATNEQLRNEKDPWLTWVTEYLRKPRL